MTEAPLRVLFVSPPLDASGGVGRVSQYELAVLESDPSVRVRHVDSRGRGGVPASFVVALRVAWHVLRHRRDYDVVHINTSIWASTLRKGLIGRAARAAGLPYVVHVHGSGYDEFFARLPAPLKWWVRSYVRHAAHVIVLGRHWQAFAIGTLGLPAERVTIVPNTAPGPEVPPLHPAGGPVQAAFLGELGERKGCHLALEALALLRRDGLDVRLTVAGNGDEAPLRAIVEREGLDAEFLGWVDATQVGEVLAASDVLLLPSASENQPISVIEALAFGVVPVVTDVGAVSDVVEDGTSGVLLPERSAEAVAEALRSLCDPELRARLSGAARARWEAELTPAHHVAQILAVWRAAA